jgi:hypothetical protein
MQEICTRTEAGESLSAICEEVHMPSRMCFYAWLKKDPEFEEMHRQAMVARTERYAEETTLLADEARRAPPELTQAYRLAVEQRRWITGKLMPKKYGDKVTLAGDADNPLSVDIRGASELLSKIRGGDAK